ncbi:zinc dependent phospholipase C family protein [Mucilaginibacter sp. RS28]|uniref:Zinc dependent phospholipase C family protein n=1 Tax=Mucilaginibacter straminoryzae TaxID=2932774 RepID=A0A9X2BA03_9SPHI|nr:zinc dependent phospholipase C family protein [Mucilaginibacter straminoryzae]MCJ8210961.1 zinc dependent phospholipase C family protein [Mucilaginibacter straminoryzae]
MFKYLSRLFPLICFLLICQQKANAYAVLAHEAIIDACWATKLKPMLLKRFPNTPDSSLRVAHSYAYGGSLVADMGYMPMGSMEFSDLLHYVRSGDFVVALLKEAQNINEYAFALGALSHYVADEYGHSRATNLTVPIIYEKLQKKYGNFVTYADDHVSHSRVEFSFDVLQVARGNYNPDAYHDFIGFNVSKPVLERAFLRTYGQHIDDLFGNFESSVATMRWGVNKLFPTLIKRTWKSEKDTIMKRQPGITARKFKYKMNKHQYHREFGKEHERPGFWASVTTFLIHVLPKVGPLKTLKYVDPGQKGEALFVKSFDTILVNYSTYLQQCEQPGFKLKDIDFDTGRKTSPGEYPLADQAYAALILKLKDLDFKYITPELKQHLLDYCKDPARICGHKRYPVDSNKFNEALALLKQSKPAEQQLIGNLTEK